MWQVNSPVVVEGRKYQPGDLVRKTDIPAGSWVSAFKLGQFTPYQQPEEVQAIKSEESKKQSRK